MAIVWPCLLSVAAYCAAGGEIKAPRHDCPDCLVPMIFWGGYCRRVRLGPATGDCPVIFVPRQCCPKCGATHAMLPSFVLAWRLDPVEVIGSVISAVAGEGSSLAAAARAEPAAGWVPYETARGWWRAFTARGRPEQLAGMFSAVAVELNVAHLPRLRAADLPADALTAVRAAFRAAVELPGWLGAGCWGLASCVTGGKLLAPNITARYAVIGKRRLMVPVPP